MEKKITITYRWWNDEVGNVIPQDTQQILEDRAMERIMEMMEHGYTAGELIYEDENNWSGWFEITTETL